MAKTLAEKLTQGRQYRNMTFSVRNAENEEEKAYIIEGYATTFNHPYIMYEDGEYRFLEQVAPEAFNACNMDDVIFQYDHCGRVYARISNKTLQLECDEHGLKIIADLGGTEEGRKLYEEIKGGYITKMSFGFTVEEDEVEEKKADGVTEVLRTITKIAKLYDVSAVSLPANDGTEISARNWCDGVIAELEKRKIAENEQRKVQYKKERERLALELSFSL